MFPMFPIFPTFPAFPACAERGSRRASSRGIIPRAKVKTVKMTIVIVIGKRSNGCLGKPHRCAHPYHSR